MIYNNQYPPPIEPRDVAWLKRRGFSVAVIAKACGVHDGAVRRWARGGKGDRRTRQAFAALLDLVQRWEDAGWCWCSLPQVIRDKGFEEALAKTDKGG